MMSSLALECYEKLRRDVKQILAEESNLVEEDGVLVDSVMAFLNNPEHVLQFARGLKEDGNALFKEGKVDEALENYGYGGVVLVRCKFEKDEDKVEFFDLVLSILLNFTACLGRKNEFSQVGQVCSTILEYMPNNVKALFRRAKAAKALGRSDLAYWDLVQAADIEPKNGEVKKAIEEIKNTHAKDKLVNGNQDQAPIGLGLSLPLSKKKPRRKQEKVQVEDQNQLCGSDKANVVELCDEEPYMKEKEGSVKDTGALSTSTEEGVKFHGVDRHVETSCSTHSSVTYTTNFSHNSINENSSNLAGPNYRFYNRRRRGSFFNITKTNYRQMAQGKTLMFYNARLGTFMQARVVQEANEFSTIKNEGKVQEKKQKINDDVQSMEASLECASCMSSEDKHAAHMESNDSPIEDDRCSVNMTPKFHFSTNSATKTERKGIEVKSTCPPQVQGSTKRRKLSVNVCPSSPSTNVVCGCRFEVGKKRKFAHPYSLVLCNRPRKRCSAFVCNSYFKVECSYYDCNVCYLGNDSSIGCVAYEMAHGQSNRYE